jgi:N-methylhydantoinase A
VVLHEADLMYRGQSHVLRVPVASPGFDAARLLSDFTRRYKQRFDIELQEMRPVLANLRTTVIGTRPKVDLRMFAPTAADPADAELTRRQVYFAGAWLDTPVYRREALAAGISIAGPAIVEQRDATTVIDPGATARVDDLGNLVIAIDPARLGAVRGVA